MRMIDPDDWVSIDEETLLDYEMLRDTRTINQHTD